MEHRRHEEISNFFLRSWPQKAPNAKHRKLNSTTIPEKNPKKYRNPDSIERSALLMAKIEFLEEILW